MIRFQAGELSRRNSSRASQEPLLGTCIYIGSDSFPGTAQRKLAGKLSSARRTKPSRDRKGAVCDEVDRVRQRWRAQGTSPGGLTELSVGARGWGSGPAGGGGLAPCLRALSLRVQPRALCSHHVPSGCEPHRTPLSYGRGSVWNCMLSGARIHLAPSPTAEGETQVHSVNEILRLAGVESTLRLRHRWAEPPGS